MAAAGSRPRGHPARPPRSRPKFGGGPTVLAAAPGAVRSAEAGPGAAPLTLETSGGLGRQHELPIQPAAAPPTLRASGPARPPPAAASLGRAAFARGLWATVTPTLVRGAPRRSLHSHPSLHWPAAGSSPLRPRQGSPRRRRGGALKRPGSSPPHNGFEQVGGPDWPVSAPREPRDWTTGGRGRGNPLLPRLSFPAPALGPTNCGLPPASGTAPSAAEPRRTHPRQVPKRPRACRAASPTSRGRAPTRLPPAPRPRDAHAQASKGHPSSPSGDVGHSPNTRSDVYMVRLVPSCIGLMQSRLGAERGHKYVGSRRAAIPEQRNNS